MERTEKEEKKGFWARLLDTLDKKMVQKSKEGGCCCCSSEVDKDGRTKSCK